ncbi:12059_t:CDS:2 [Entrophospora sp. SA101]|nr:13587_t:CDS:2 [Entrophospora sp. SA101]CAJ0630870.1 12059_t:CDS:2 [Entrophospora sp. SA101]CAJ0842650.1 12146_t:CDS:2 [Entrophospora sp. SA101]CAJ0859534.1 11573_t:CDS:2 [Entrophospora sp. SA101]
MSTIQAMIEIRLLKYLFLFIIYILWKIQKSDHLWKIPNEIKDLSDTIQKVEVEPNDTLVPPALTLCIEKDLEYYFSAKVHGIETGNDYITKFESNDPNLTKYGLNVAKCWARNIVIY